MPDGRDVQRLQAIVEKIEFIEHIVDKYDKVSLALLDEELAKPAIMMHFVAIAEQFSKIKSQEIINSFGDSIRGAMSIRNFIAHDYDGVNLTIIETTIKEILPNLKEQIKRTLETL